MKISLRYLISLKEIAVLNLWPAVDFAESFEVPDAAVSEGGGGESDSFTTCCGGASSSSSSSDSW